ncbi:MAG: hypothetical protein A2808_03975 [Candidatus Moranbacteria bacterium RIFCSPHIGHO2_01_FULL_55_24]|nr:MAG: hypothetical protein A2808_03975 [Candidatus Moranbacteria bacterium RIFCSPHIGHO2_01_FULL_55_24]
MQTYTFHVHGMHCNSCVVLTESELKELPGVAYAKTSLKDQTVRVTGTFEGKTEAELAEEFTAALRPHGYTLSLEKEEKSIAWIDFRYALPLALLLMGIFVLLQRLGVVNLVTTADVNYGTAFVIGLIASVSTCMAVVGGLVLSVSANFAKEGEKTRPQMLFHSGRLVAFFFLGGAIGSLGAVFQLGTGGTFILGFLVSIVLLILGINLLDVFPGLKRWQLALPASLGIRMHGLKNFNHRFTPFLLGVATFFLPCGFTQSMQLYTLTTGSFWAGATLMTAFALGTLPVLALLSFSSLAIHEKAQSGIFFKTAGLVVIMFGLFNLINSLVVIGVIRPVFNF